VRARAFEREIRPDHVDDIVRGGDLLDGLRWNCHGPNGKLNRRSASWKYEDVIVNLKRGRACPADGRARGGPDSQRRCRRRAVAVLPTGEDVPLTEREKTISYFSALIRSSAKKNGHNEDIGEAFMNKDKEVKIGDRVIHPKGTILTLNAQEAAERIGGKPLLA